LQSSRIVGYKRQSITFSLLPESPKDLSSHISILQPSGSNRGEECGRQTNHRTSPTLRGRDHVPAPTSMPHPTPNPRRRKRSASLSKKVNTLILYQCFCGRCSSSRPTSESLAGSVRIRLWFNPICTSCQVNLSNRIVWR